MLSENTLGHLQATFASLKLITNVCKPFTLVLIFSHDLLSLQSHTGYFHSIGLRLRMPTKEGNSACSSVLKGTRGLLKGPSLIIIPQKHCRTSLVFWSAQQHPLLLRICILTSRTQQDGSVGKVLADPAWQPQFEPKQR